jgi:polysaccharide biosynthesis/export protein
MSSIYKNRSRLKRIMNFIILCAILLLFGNELKAEQIYHIGPGDHLEISVWRDESLSREVVVPPDNKISFPLIGDINVTNMTVADLRSAITKKLSEFIPDATVTVIIKEIHSLRAYVIGKVIRPGDFDIRLDTDVMQILSMAGGLNPYADPDKILIIRRIGSKIEKIPFNYSKVAKGQNLNQNIILKSGDIVVVP